MQSGLTHTCVGVQPGTGQVCSKALAPKQPTKQKSNTHAINSLSPAMAAQHNAAPADRAQTGLTPAGVAATAEHELGRPYTSSPPNARAVPVPMRQASPKAAIDATAADGTATKAPSPGDTWLLLRSTPPASGSRNSVPGRVS